jgi:hypothetical protein
MFARHPSPLPRRTDRLLLRPHSQTTAFESRGRPKPRTGNHPGGRSPSQVSDALLLTGHVARRCYPPSFSPCLRAPARGQFPAAPKSGGFQGAKRRNSPLPISEKPFAVRLRLQPESLPSDSSPFMVELFTAGGFAPGPRLRSKSRLRPVTRPKAPHGSRVERAVLARAPRTGFAAMPLTRFESSQPHSVRD